MFNPFTNPFRTHAAERINARRLEHLASLDLPLTHRSVLEVGAGEGHLSHFWLDRHCQLTITDGRASNVRKLCRLYPEETVYIFDITETPILQEQFDIVFCYGTLYHTGSSASVLAKLCDLTTDLFLLETMIGHNEIVSERYAQDQSLIGQGSRPEYFVLTAVLRKKLGYAYAPAIYPNHLDFSTGLRVILIGSRKEIDNKKLIAIG